MDGIRILNNNYNPSIVWSNRARENQYFRELKQRIKRFLLSVSGNDLVAMLNDVLDVNEISNLKITKMHIEALRQISTAVNNKDVVKSKSKHHFIRPLRQSGFSISKAKELGFNFSIKLWISCQNTTERNLGGRPELLREVVREMNRHLEPFTTIASNKSVVVRTFANRNPFFLHKPKVLEKNLEAARFRQITFNESFRQFKQIAINNCAQVDIDDPNIPEQTKKFHKICSNIRFSTYHRYVDKKFRKPKLFSDLCDHCELGKKIVKEMNFSLPNFHVTLDQDFNSAELINRLNNLRGARGNTLEYLERIDRFIEQATMLDKIKFHKSIADRQRLAYNRHRSFTRQLHGKLLIEIDYKAKIILGQGDRVMNTEWFERNKKKVVCCSFGIFYIGGEHQHSILLKNIDVLSDYMGTEALDFVRVFRHVRTMPCFQELDQNEYVIWTDCGSQFRCKEFAHYCFKELANEGIRVNLNFLCEKHGKNQRDQHFSVMSRAMQKYKFKNQKGLKTSQELANCLNANTMYINEGKLAENKYNK